MAGSRREGIKKQMRDQKCTCPQGVEQDPLNLRTLRVQDAGGALCVFFKGEITPGLLPDRYFRVFASEIA